jgi:hypothetical protein
MRRAAMIALWVVATGITTAVAYVAVNAAGASVTDRPLTAVVAADVPRTSTSAATTIQSSITAPSTPSSTSSTSIGSTSSTSTTTSSAPWEQTTVNSAAGAVIVSYRANEVQLESVVPLAGFRYEIDEAGPREVRVKFEAAVLRVEIRIRWENGTLVTEIDENN